MFSDIRFLTCKLLGGLLLLYGSWYCITLHLQKYWMQTQVAYIEINVKEAVKPDFYPSFITLAFTLSDITRIPFIEKVFYFLVLLWNLKGILLFLILGNFLKWTLGNFMHDHYQQFCYLQYFSHNLPFQMCVIFSYCLF